MKAKLQLLAWIAVIAVVAIGVPAMSQPTTQAKAALHKKMLRAIKTGNAAAVTSLLDRGADPNDYFGNRADDEDYTALETWLDYNHDPNNHHTANTMTVIRSFIKHGAEVNGHSLGDGKTALSVAALTGNKTALPLLLADGADINDKNAFGQTVLIIAVTNGSNDNIRLLLKDGANPNLRDNLGETALSWATKLSETRAVAILKTNGAN